MFISPIKRTDPVEQAEQVTDVTEVTEVTQIPATAEKQSPRRYQYLFQGSPLQKNQSLFKSVINLVNKFINQMIGRKSAAEETPAAPSIRQVRGIADRMPHLVDPKKPMPERDTIFLGEARDYPAAVIAIELNNTTKPVFYEGNQVVARHLNLDTEQTSMQGTLIFNDGNRMPVEVMVITAV